VSASVLTRRSFVVGSAGLIAASASVGRVRAVAAEPLNVGFIYVGSRDDFGYNQAHAEGAAALKGMPGIKVLEEERVPETVDVTKTMDSMIQLDDATLLFPTSFGYYSPFVLDEAKKNPKIEFRHCGGLWKSTDPVNAGSYFGYIDEAQYLSGIVAGHATKSKKIGFVAAKPIPQVLRNINAFSLGAQSVDPAIVTHVIFTGDWSLPVKEAEATNSLADSGIDVVTCHVDGPKVVIQTAESRGMHSCGYHVSQAPLAPKGYLTGAEWNWAKVYKGFVADMQAGKPLPNFVRGAFKEGIIKTSAYTAAVPEAARKHADDVKAKLTAGTYVIFKGPLKDNTGKQVIAAGEERRQTDVRLEQMNWLVKGVVGTV
jgi:basic membrane protein A